LFIDVAYVEDEGHPCDVITEIKPAFPWRTLAWESCHAKQHFGISAFYSGGQIEIPDLFSNAQCLPNLNEPKPKIFRR